MLTEVMSCRDLIGDSYSYLQDKVQDIKPVAGFSPEGPVCKNVTEANMYKQKDIIMCRKTIDWVKKPTDCYYTASTHFSCCIYEQYFKHYQYKNHK